MEIIFETIFDSIKIIPFLFLTFLIMELIEHKVNSEKIIKKVGKVGPLFGSLLGMFPQCGFSVAATNLFSSRVITLGTLISIYLSTSDEMIPILLSKNIELKIILQILSIKFVIGMIFGFLIDILLKDKNKNLKIEEKCDLDQCHCEENIILSSFKHTIKIFTFIIVASFILNYVIFAIGENNLKKIMECS